MDIQDRIVLHRAERRKGGGRYIIEVAFDDVNVRRDGSEKVVCLSVGDVACAYCLLYFAWHKELFEFCGDRGCSRGNVEVANDENKDHSLCCWTG